MRTVSSGAQADSHRVQAGAHVASTQDTATESRPLLYEVTGHGDPVVLVPGSLTGWASWISHTERLATSHMVVRVQVRNVELVEAGMPIPGTYGVATEREGLRATVDALGLDRFDLVGWSLGGAVSLAFAFAWPERVRTLTLIEPAALWMLRESGHAPATLAAEEAADRALGGRVITIDDLTAFLVRAGLGQPDADFASHPRWPIMVRNRQALSTNVAEWEHTESPERLRALQVPILIVRGTETSELLGAVVDAVVATAPQVTLLELPGGHACHIEQIDRFLEALETHLGQG
jgi:pimeloyl-ACP methyl ester carboxylesterase